MKDCVRRFASKDDLKTLELLDSTVYPVSKPCLVENYEKWYLRNPEFGMVYVNKDGIVEGCAYIIPLKLESWNLLRKGLLEESTIEESHLFNKATDNEAGLCLHVYHIEKFSRSSESITMRVLSDLSKIVRDDIGTRYSNLCFR